MTDRDTNAGGRELKGYHVLIIALTAFGVIIAANMTMLMAATGTFPGLVVENSYRAGVGWNDRAAAQRALGWEVGTGYDAGVLVVSVTDAEGAAVSGIALSATVGRPASAAEDRELALRYEGGRYVAPVALEPGLWRVAITGAGKGAARYETAAELYVRPGASAD